MSRDDSESGEKTWTGAVRWPDGGSTEEREEEFASELDEDRGRWMIFGGDGSEEEVIDGEESDDRREEGREGRK